MISKLVHHSLKKFFAVIIAPLLIGNIGTVFLDLLFVFYKKIYQFFYSIATLFSG